MIGYITVKVPMPFRHREVKTMLLYGFARQLCANLYALCRLCASTKLPTFIYSGASECMGV